MNYEGVHKFILNKLEKELDPRLTYHSVSHTMDVLESAIRLADMEKISGDDKMLLKTACLFHDTGMLVTYRGHEEASINICKETLPAFNYSPAEIGVICRMISTTKLPQCASELLDKILCDADLDYLGRRDFFMIAHRLRYEWDILGIYPTTLQEWYKIQRDFLTAHKYFTDSAIHLRQAYKMENLRQVEFMCNHEK
ncbi:MAG: HD domain-containing protein [Bacteroidales bacterium]|jgi:predicted metal-dependent HD superfamily phosphohydrolase|nr:HD domain-containing protein [Bacteroidales bacterium]